MTSIPDSQIFISPSETTAFVADPWPLREDVFAPDANLSGKTATARCGIRPRYSGCR
jgi:hypothetical protein